MEVKNPFGSGIRTVLGQLAAMKWAFPFLHNLVSVVVCLIVLVILTALYPTIGLGIQLTILFGNLILQTAREMRGKPPTERIGQVVAIGIYLIFYCAFGLVSLPFYLLGCIVDLPSLFRSREWGDRESPAEGNRSCRR